MAKYAEYKRYTRSRAGNVLYFGFLFLMGAFSVLPLFYCVCTAFKPLDELLIFPPRFFVSRPTIENFTVLPSLLEKLSVPFARYIFNSFFIAICTAVLNLFASSMAAYVLSKSRIKGRVVFFMIVQFSLLYNATTLAVPQYLIFSKLHLINTYWVYILPAIPSSMGAFLIKQYIDSGVPDALLEAAKIDGAGVFTVYLRIVMPIIKPALMTQLLFSFQSIWSITPTNGTIFSEELKTLPYVMGSIATGGTARAGSAMASTVLLMIPPIIVYFISQSNIMETMSSAGLKE